MLANACQRFPDLEVPVIDGDFRLVYEPDPQVPKSWMVNDHCLIRDQLGKLHYFGIENPFPSTAQALEWLEPQLTPSEQPFIQTLHRLIHGHLYRPGTHTRIGHAVADNIFGPWKRLPAAIDNGLQAGYHGSPFVIRHEGQYWLFEPGEGTGIYTSSDLVSWSPVPDATDWRDPAVFGVRGHRDPCIIRLDDGTFLQYFAASDLHDRFTVGLARSVDLKYWEPQAPCYVEDFNVKAPFGVFESPFVWRRGRLFYLFVNFSHRHYYETFVIVSDNPLNFESQYRITTLFTHAPELIELDGTVYMSSCGIEDPQALNYYGLWICQLKWLRP